MTTATAELITLDKYKPADLYGEGGEAIANQIVESLAVESRAIVFDMDTAEGRDELRSYAFKITKSKTAAAAYAKAYGADLKAQVKQISTVDKVLTDGLAALAVEIRAPLTRHEERQAQLEVDYAKFVEGIDTLGRVAFGESVEQITARRERLKAGLEAAEKLAPQFIDPARASAQASLDTVEHVLREAIAAAEALEEANRKAAADAEAKAIEDEKARLAAEEQAEKDRKAEAEQQRLADENAELKRQLAAAQAKPEPEPEPEPESIELPAAPVALKTPTTPVVEISAFEKAQTAKKATHKAAIDALDANCDFLSIAQCAEIISHIALGRVPAVSINYAVDQ